MNELDTILSLMRVPSTEAIRRQNIRRWMKSLNLEVLGAIDYLISDKRFYKRIQPPLEFNDYHPFKLRYYARCLKENPDGKWSDSRYSAGHDLVNWFVGLWDDQNIPRHALEDLKHLLAELYLEGDSELRRCIIDATLEHLFERSEIARFFEDWKNDPVLNVGYDEAMDWSRGTKGTPARK